MTPGEATAMARAMHRRWPYPELDEEGQRLLAASLVATNLDAVAAEDAIRHLMATRTSGFRPEPGEIAEVARQRNAAARRPAAGALPAGPGSQPTSKAETLGQLSWLTLQARDARARLAERIGMPVERCESGTMRHISSLIGIGPVAITGRDPHATELATELLARHDRAVESEAS